MTVPGQIVIKVFKTNFVSKLILFSAPILLDEASVNNLLCKSMTRHIKYNLSNIGNDRSMSIGTLATKSSLASYLRVTQIK